MKKITLKSFCEYVGEENAKLVRACYNHMGLDKEDFFQELVNIAHSPCGAAGGYCGFIYYTETTKFWRKYRKTIKKVLAELSDNIGDKSVIETLKSFNCFRNDDTFSDDDFGKALYGNFDEDLYYIYNALAWFSVEEVSHWYDNFKYENED